MHIPCYLLGYPTWYLLFYYISLFKLCFCFTLSLQSFTYPLLPFLYVISLFGLIYVNNNDCSEGKIFFFRAFLAVHLMFKWLSVKWSGIFYIAGNYIFTSYLNGSLNIFNVNLFIDSYHKMCCFLFFIPFCISSPCVCHPALPYPPLFELSLWSRLWLGVRGHGAKGGWGL